MQYYSYENVAHFVRCGRCATNSTIYPSIVRVCVCIAEFVDKTTTTAKAGGVVCDINTSERRKAGVSMVHMYVHKRSCRNHKGHGNVNGSGHRRDAQTMTSVDDRINGTNIVHPCGVAQYAALL